MGIRHHRRCKFAQSRSEAARGGTKAEYRAQIEKQGNVIVANIGDQQADIAGGHQRKAFLVPNPMYRLE